MWYKKKNTGNNSEGLRVKSAQDDNWSTDQVSAPGEVGHILDWMAGKAQSTSGNTVLCGQWGDHCGNHWCDAPDDSDSSRISSGQHNEPAEPNLRKTKQRKTIVSFNGQIPQNAAQAKDLQLLPSQLRTTWQSSTQSFWTTSLQS